MPVNSSDIKNYSFEILIKFEISKATFLSSSKSITEFKPKSLDEMNKIWWKFSYCNIFIIVAFSLQL